MPTGDGDGRPSRLTVDTARAAVCSGWRRRAAAMLAPGVVLLVAGMVQAGDRAALGSFAKYALMHAAGWGIVGALAQLLPSARARQLIAALAWVVPAASVAPALATAPLAALLSVLVTWRVAEALVTAPAREIYPTEPRPWLPAAAIWLAGVVAGIAGGGLTWVATLATTFGAGLFGTRAVWRTSGATDAQRYGLMAALVLAAAAGALGQPGVAATGALAVAYVAARVKDAAEGGDEPRFGDVWDDALADPARALVVTFAIIGLVGGLALSSPAAREAGVHVSLLDAMFTSFSATCVTGLGVVDTPMSYGPVGEAVILALIQVGGLGIMTFSAAAASLLRRRMTLAQEATMAGLMATDDRRNLNADVHRVVGLTLVVEAAGALALTLQFWRLGDTFGQALWRGVFTSISAFCNAGFALQSDSLVGYAGHPGVLYTVAALIIIGGLGPAVIFGAVAAAHGRPTPVGVRLAVWVSAGLTALGAVLYLALERDASLGNLGFWDAIHNAFFQSVTLRTAGFNSVDLAAARPATVAMMIMIMFVGGSPGSTAGGVKTTTIAVLLLGAEAVARGRTEVSAFGYRLPTLTVLRAGAIGLLGTVSVCLVFFALLATQRIPFDSLLFESVSALATVGLSVGATGALDATGKLLIIAAMFAGRVGPLTLVLLFAGPSTSLPATRPEQEVAVG
ncbi:MAG: hypothetical protein H6698_08280 [Myxococcales bacterium]|nr:hypothetical protein [Myxococcales bacterium]MCB9531123.1 hypothetical protein [Myxococcales bacterium]MCB9534286.1 hypothetical protein [Myxococcales bacterium]